MIHPPSSPVIGLDADDTLWHNENIFAAAHARYAAILGRAHEAAEVERILFATEMRNLPLYGYGIKGFALSAIETALELSGDRLAPAELRAILHLAHEMLRHPVELLPGVAETLARLAPRHRLVLLTKGDLRDQERKLRQSGLEPFFRATEIVTDKDEATYRRLLRAWGIEPTDFIMVGNSLRSDILPALALGARAVWIPYPLTWMHEAAEPPEPSARFARLDSLAELPGWLESVGLTPPAAHAS